MTHFLLPLYSLPLKNQQIRRAYRNLITKAHPDKGGDAKTFALIQRAYDVLSDTDKRKQYDSTGTYSKSVEEELLDSFGGGVFRDKLNEENQRKESVAEAIQTVEKNKGSHTSGFEAFMRARGDSVASFGVDDIINQFGVVKGSYDEVQLPKIKAYEVNQPAGKKVVAGHEKEALRVETTKIASTLQWGEVLVSVRVAPMNAHDIYEDHMSFITSNYGNNASDANVHKDSMLNPRKGAFENNMNESNERKIPGSDCLATVVKVGAGVKSLAEGDWVIPYVPNLGTWRTLAVWKEKDLMKIPKEMTSENHCAMMREMCVAYRLLEDFGALKPGDAVILNAGTSLIATVVCQLASMLKLRPILVCRAHPGFEKTVKWLKSLGAIEVFKDEGDLGAELEEKRLFAKPRLALDGVGGISAVRLAETLHQGCPLIVYACASGRAATFPWHHWVGKGLIVRGFSLRNWMKENKKKTPKMMETLAKLVNANKIAVEYTEYELSTEFDEALEHACEKHRKTKILLKITDIGSTVDENDK